MKNYFQRNPLLYQKSYFDFNAFLDYIDVDREADIFSDGARYKDFYFYKNNTKQLYNQDSVFDMLMYTNKAMFASLLFKIDKLHFLNIFYKLKITFSDYSSQLYEVLPLLEFKDSESWIFVCKFREMCIYYLLEFNHSEFKIKKKEQLTACLKENRIRNIKIVIDERQFTECICLFMKFLVFPLMIKHIRNYRKGISLMI